MTILGNIHADHKGRRVVITSTSTHRRFGTDFPGWGAANAADFLLDPKPGLTGTITAVTSEGHAPWTSYSVKFDDGSRSAGLTMGTDIEFQTVDLDAGVSDDLFDVEIGENEGC
jgi:hypothetical protein